MSEYEHGNSTLKDLAARYGDNENTIYNTLPTGPNRKNLTMAPKINPREGMIVGVTPAGSTKSYPAIITGVHPWKA